MSGTGSLIPLHEHDNKEEVLDHLTHINNKLYFYGQEVCAEHTESVIRSMINQLWSELNIPTSSSGT